MAIRLPNAPAPALEALNRGVGQLRGLPAAPPHLADLRMAPEAGAPDGLPHETYHLGLDDVDRGVEAATPVGWRVLLTANAAAEVHGGGNEYAFAGINQGPFVEQTAEVLARLRNELGDGDYEPRLLRVPALYVVALWLKERAGRGDRFVPLEPSNPEVKSGLVYSEKEFEAALKRAAEQVRRAPQKTEDSPHAP